MNHEIPTPTLPMRNTTAERLDHRTMALRYEDPRLSGWFGHTQAWTWEATPEVEAGDAIVVLTGKGPHGPDAYAVVRTGDKLVVSLLWNGIFGYMKACHGVQTTVAE